jgi:hypothetical protein
MPTFLEFDALAACHSTTRKTWGAKHCTTDRRQKFFDAVRDEVALQRVLGRTTEPTPDELRAAVKARLMSNRQNAVGFVPLWVLLLMQYVLPILIRWLWDKYQNAAAGTQFDGPRETLRAD